MGIGVSVYSNNRVTQKREIFHKRMHTTHLPISPHADRRLETLTTSDGLFNGSFTPDILLGQTVLEAKSKTSSLAPRRPTRRDRIRMVPGSLNFEEIRAEC